MLLALCRATWRSRRRLAGLDARRVARHARASASGPVGLAFYAWDHGVKHGDIRLLGVASYATPMLSTLLLVAVGFAAGLPGASPSPAC